MVQKKSGDGTVTGTGFLVRANIPDHEHHYVYLLVSNKHVYHDPKQPAEFVFHAYQKDNPALPDMRCSITHKLSNIQGVYLEHPDKEIDVACTNLSYLNAEYGIFWKALPLHMFSDFSEPDLLPGTMVWFIGYPNSLYDFAHTLPILRVGYIASMPSVDFNSRPQFIIDAQVFPGSSGSPVTCRLGNTYKFLGILSRVMVKNKALESIPISQDIGQTQELGLGIVIKSIVIKQMIDNIISEIKKRLDANKPEPTIMERN